MLHVGSLVAYMCGRCVPIAGTQCVRVEGDALCGSCGFTLVDPGAPGWERGMPCSWGQTLDALGWEGSLATLRWAVSLAPEFRLPPHTGVIFLQAGGTAIIARC